MGFWTGIKYALNSTIGTPWFRPLDDLVGRELTGSGIQVYATLYAGAIGSGAIDTAVNIPGSAMVYCNGSVSVRFEVAYNNAGTFNVDVVHTDGTSDSYSTSYIKSEATDNVYRPYRYYATVNVKIKKGDILNTSFMRTTSGEVTVEVVSIMAIEVPPSLVKVID